MTHCPVGRDRLRPGTFQAECTVTAEVAGNRQMGRKDRDKQEQTGIGWGHDREGTLDFGAKGARQPGHGARSWGLVILRSLSSHCALPAYITRQQAPTWGFWSWDRRHCHFLSPSLLHLCHSGFPSIPPPRPTESCNRLSCHCTWVLFLLKFVATPFFSGTLHADRAKKLLKSQLVGRRNLTLHSQGTDLTDF